MLQKSCLNIFVKLRCSYTAYYMHWSVDRFSFSAKCMYVYNIINFDSNDSTWVILGCIYKYIYTLNVTQPITMAALSKAWTVFARSKAGIADSNPSQGMDVCMLLSCVCVVLCVGSGLATGWSPVKRVLLIVYRIKKLKNRPRFNIDR
jgi:hypothetical protein